MDRSNRLLHGLCAVLTAALMAGCAACLAVRAFGLPVFGAYGYLAALYAAALVRLGRRGAIWGVGATALLAIPCAFLLAARANEIFAALRTAAQGAAGENLAAYASAANAAALLAGILLGALFALLLDVPSGSSFALAVLLAAVICGLALNEDISLWAALPGFVGGVIAFALPKDVRRDGVRPLLLIPALLLSLLALSFSPAARTTWEPLENLAERVRSITRDYMRFTEERLAFSINEKGYDHAGMIGEDVVAMLGGPADPSEDAVMRVETDVDLLLRGTVKRSYTGYSWVDDQTKARYLYYDFLHRNVRNQVFDAQNTEEAEGFCEHSARVEMLENGTSTLFVPNQLASFEMSLEDAVYYNSAGEIFLTREVEPGDSYAFVARMPDSDAALIAACADSAQAQDGQYAAIQADYTVLPDGIDSRVYALALELTQNVSNAAEKALSIENYLAENYNYTLNGGYPAQGEDFVSWFLLEGKEGYCSYFASSMAVLCRIAGLPARYVEGYSVPASSGGATIVTGENAHAWVEVYFNGLGWIAFDPTARSMEHGGGESASENGGMDDSGVVDEFSGEDDASAENPAAPEATPTPQPDGSAGDPSDAPTPTPQPDADSPQANEPPAGQHAPKNTDSPNSKKKNHIWLWLLLILLLLALCALGALWLRRRLNASDPLKLCASMRSADLAAMVLYRGILTLLVQIGIAPLNGETPQAFAQRASGSIANPAYERFVEAVTRSRYSGRKLEADALEDGRKAYLVFLNGLRRSERLRFHVHRAFHGLGSFENIP